jgi:hypothetical protein
MARWRAVQKHKLTQSNAEAASGSVPALSKNERILELLTAEQRIAWRELTGTPFTDLHR